MSLHILTYWVPAASQIGGLCPLQRRPARLLEVEQAALASHVTPVVCCDVVPLFVSLGTLECWGGRQEECGPEMSCEPVCLCLCVARACRHHLSSVHTHTALVSSPSPVRAWLFFTFLTN